MSVEIVLNGESQIILGEGHGHRWNIWNLSALGVILGLSIFIFSMWYALSRPIPIPSNTTIIAVISPKVAKRILPASIEEKLPAVCKDAFASDSDWPVICGLTSSNEAFAIMPRWLTKKGTTTFTSGLIARTGRVQTETKPFQYTEALAWRGFAKQPTVLIESSIIEERLGLDIATSSTKILFHWNGKGFASDMKLPVQTTPLPAGDIAFSVNNEAWNELSGDVFLDAANLPDRNQWQPLPPIERFAIWIDENHVTKGKYIGFSEPLDQENAARLLGLMGVTERKAITLPDGSISYERLLPSPSTSTSLFGQRQNNQGQLIELAPRFIAISNASTTLEQNNTASCGTSYPWIRLSSNVLKDILNIPVPSLQGYSENQYLSICFEH